jgi:hypothetical protein
MPLPEIVRVPLPPAVAAAVRSLAYTELRDPPRQAAWLVAEALRARGALPPEPTAAVTLRRDEGPPDAA